MNSKTLISVFLAMAMVSSGFAIGQGNGRSDDRSRNEKALRSGPPDRHDDRRPLPSDFRIPNRSDDRAHLSHDNRGAGPDNSWHRSARLRPQYRSQQYVVDDWRSHGLSAPPHGFHWVQNDGDYILVAIATGVIQKLLRNN